MAELFADVLAGHLAAKAAAHCGACGRKRQPRTRPDGRTYLDGAAGKCGACYSAGRRIVPGRGPRPSLKLSDSGYSAYGVASAPQETAGA